MALAKSFFENKVRSDAAKVIQRHWREHRLERMRRQQTEGYQVGSGAGGRWQGGGRARRRLRMQRCSTNGCGTTAVAAPSCVWLNSSRRARRHMLPAAASGPCCPCARMLFPPGPAQRKGHAGHAGAAARRPGAAPPRQPGLLGADPGGERRRGGRVRSTGVGSSAVGSQQAGSARRPNSSLPAGPRLLARFAPCVLCEMQRIATGGKARRAVTPCTSAVAAPPARRLATTWMCCRTRWSPLSAPFCCRHG